MPSKIPTWRRRMDAGLCPRCKAPAQGGKRHCLDCQAAQKQASRERYYAWLAQGKCPRCGGMSDREYTCSKCLRLQSERARARYAAGAGAGTVIE